MTAVTLGSKIYSRHLRIVPDEFISCTVLLLCFTAKLVVCVNWASTKHLSPTDPLTDPLKNH